MIVPELDWDNLELQLDAMVGTVFVGAVVKIEVSRFLF
jgi:hypothetical protein